MKYFDEETKEKFIPYIIETSAGASRSFMAFLVNAYAEEEAPSAEGQMETRVVMKFHPNLAPIKAAIFPLVNRDGMPELARKIETELRPHMPRFLRRQRRSRKTLSPPG